MASASMQSRIELIGSKGMETTRHCDAPDVPGTTLGDTRHGFERGLARVQRVWQAAVGGRLGFDGSSEDWKRWGWATLAALCVFLALGLASLHFPVFPGKLGVDRVISAATRAGYAPANNYLRFAFLFVCALCAFVGTLRFHPHVPAETGRPVESQAGRSGRDQRTRSAAALLFVLALTTAVGRSSVDPGQPLADPFHDGELFGFVPAAREDRPLENTFLIHGPGRNLLPALIADRIAPVGKRIPTTRILVAALQYMAYAASFLCVLLIARLTVQPRSCWVTYFALGLLMFLAADGTMVKVNERDAVFLLGLASVLAFIDSAQRAWPFRAAVFGFAAGAMLPLGFAFVYDRAVYSSAMAVATTLLFCLTNSKLARWWAASFFPGLVAGAFLFAALVHDSGTRAIADQVLYWGQYGRDIWTTPLFDRPPLYKTQESALLVTAYNLLYILPLGSATVLLCWGITLLLGKNSGRSAWRDLSGQGATLWILCLGTLLALRVPLDRNVVLMPPTVGLLLAALLLIAVGRTSGLVRGFGTGGTLRGAVGSEIGIIVLLFAGLAFRGEFIAAWRTADSYASELRDRTTADDKLVPRGLLLAARRLAEESRGAPCIFSTDSNGMWYFLVDKPSCSRFHQLVYARSIAAQGEVVMDLERTRPSLIVFEDSIKGIDGINSFNATPIVIRYVLEHYAPHLALGDAWLWSVRGRPIRFVGDAGGTTITSVPQTMHRSADALIEGSVSSREFEGQTTAVVVTYGSDNIPVSAGRWARESGGRILWRALVPTAVLPQGDVLLRIWITGNGDGVLRKASSDIVVRVD